MVIPETLKSFHHFGNLVRVITRDAGIACFFGVGSTGGFGVGVIGFSGGFGAGAGGFSGGFGAGAGGFSGGPGGGGVGVGVGVGGLPIGPGLPGGGCGNGGRIIGFAICFISFFLCVSQCTTMRR